MRLTGTVPGASMVPVARPHRPVSLRRKNSERSEKTLSSPLVTKLVPKPDEPAAGRRPVTRAMCWRWIVSGQFYGLTRTLNGCSKTSHFDGEGDSTKWGDWGRWQVRPASACCSWPEWPGLSVTRTLQARDSCSGYSISSLSILEQVDATAGELKPLFCD